MKSSIERYRHWLEKAECEPELKEELESINGQPEEIDARFFRDLAFGTGGMRGVMGAGTYRMNYFTVGRVSQAAADVFLAEKRSCRVAIAYDSRNNSRRFAERTAEVFAGNGMHVFIYPRLMPTPALSFAVRELRCDFGVVITASHNPRQYNGYKVYNATGSQITGDLAKRIQRAYESTDAFSSVREIRFAEALQAGKIEFIPSEICERMRDAETGSCFESGETDKSFRIVYTPLNGTGISCVPECLKKMGYANLIIPEEQGSPDGNFPTCPLPNPEADEAMRLGVEYAEKYDAELLLATDPDCDRVSAACRAKDGFRRLSGNQLGLLLFDYICRRRSDLGTMPERPIACKTIVTTSLAGRIAEEYGVELRNALTGFKYIGEQIDKLESAGETDRFIFGFEESCGYLSNVFVRDKDGINAVILTCEMFAWHRQHGRMLFDALDQIYRKYGYCSECQISRTFDADIAVERIQGMMQSLRQSPFDLFTGLRIREIVDYQNGIDDLPRANMIRFILDDGEAVVRPSGTEPKIKIYLSAIKSDREAADELLNRMKRAFERWIQA